MGHNLEHRLTVNLALRWLHGNEYDATVYVTLTDTCYHEGDLTVGLPPGTVGIPETEFDPDSICGRKT
jgi:hypothetical protein